METLLGGALLLIIGGTVIYLFFSRIVLPIYMMIKQNARLK